MKFDKIAILGGGLLGGSLALRAQRLMGCSLWVRRPEAVAEAAAIGIRGATHDLRAALAGADLVMLTVPVGAMPDLVARALESGLSSQAVISDVGSVKQAVHRSLEALPGAGQLRFIGGHPMAGSEARGLPAARIGLFDGAACLLTDDGQVGEPWAAALEHFWRLIGCRVHWLTASDHDQLVARISHVPHLMAALTSLVGFRDPADGEFAGGGIRDTTRVAAGDPCMWAEILMENREAVAAALRPARESLAEILALLDGADHQGLREWLAHARQLHAAAAATGTSSTP